MWERTLQDLIRGLRANKQDEATFINKAVNEIREEIKNKDMELKAGAIMKLTYLDMLGYDMSWASFHVVEVMSSPKFHLKCVGYLAASQSFSTDTDVLMLTTNLLKKDLSGTPLDISVTLNGLSQFITPDLARDLHPEITSMLNHSRPVIRKRAVVALYKIIASYPDVVSFALPRLAEKLNDPDQGMRCVVSATVNVLCELVRQNPNGYLTLAPQLFHLLTTSSNNWLLIKVIKLFGALTPHEPRLVQKLQKPIKDLISTTPAISLLYECVHTCIVGGMLQPHSGDALARTCVTKLATFLQDPDQNLKYIALLALVKIVPSHPHLVGEYQRVILSSIDDQDMSIRMRALDLVSAMVDEDNLQSITQQLLSHLARPDSVAAIPTAVHSLSQHAQSPPGVPTSTGLAGTRAYRLTLAQRILSICSRDTYVNVTDFEWYLSVLVDLAYVASVDVGLLIRDQLVDIVGRVKAARRYAVKLMVKLLNDDTFLLNAADEGSCAEVLWAAAWICGEYCGELAEPQKLLPVLLQPTISKLHPETVAVYIHAATKVFAFWAVETAKRWDNDDLPKLTQQVNYITERLQGFAADPNIEVQERAANSLGLFVLISADLSQFKPRPAESYAFAGDSGAFEPASTEPEFPKSLYLIHPLVSAYPLNPVASVAQENVPIPEGLELDKWIVPPPKDIVPTHVTGEGERGRRPRKKKGKQKEANGKVKEKAANEPLQEDVLTTALETETEKAERERVGLALMINVQKRLERIERLKDDPYYIFDKKELEKPLASTSSDVDTIPIVHLGDLMPIAPTPALAETILREDLQPPPHQKREFVVDREGEMPTLAKPPLPNPNELRQSMTSTPVSVSSFLIHDAGGDDVPRSRSLDPIKVTRSKKKGTTGKKKRTSKPEVVVD
ncbi:adaptin N terminal region-domain-containing protein [Thelephora terrestris]|uniref:AP-3 complex subunit delta n=1 Tax=Thelephora terrestris TaxID=56493 RepID=A0A9P6L880_9AGAM|nr:adaptin N terminal region-domain-containing protein [Thelephora terrestris]